LHSSDLSREKKTMQIIKFW